MTITAPPKHSSDDDTEDRPVVPLTTGPSWSQRVKARAAARPPKRTAALPAATAVTMTTSLVVSALALWLLLFGFVFSGMQAARSNQVLFAELRENLSGATTPIGGYITPGTPIALMQAPAIGLRDQVIVEGTAPEDLQAGPGHLRTSPLPGQAGVSQLYGRSVTYGGPFGDLHSLRRGDRITVTTGQGRFVYAVDQVRHAGDPLPGQLAAGGSRLLLETSSGVGFEKSDTVFADASLIKGKVQVAPSGRPTALLPEEQAMKGDTSVLLPLVFWLQGLVLVALGVVWARSRWGLWQAWLLGVPLLMALLWGSGSTVLMLVPNLV